MLLSEANLMFNVLNASVLQFAMPHGFTLALIAATVVVVAGVGVVAVAIAQECAVESTFRTSIHSCSFLCFSEYTKGTVPFVYFYCFIFKYSSYDTAPCLRAAISCSNFSLSSARLAAMACCFPTSFPLARSRRKAAALSSSW